MTLLLGVIPVISSGVERFEALSRHLHEVPVTHNDRAPTKQAQEVYDDLCHQIDEQVAKFKQLESTEVAAFNQALREAQVPVIAAPPVKEE